MSLLKNDGRRLEISSPSRFARPIRSGVTLIELMVALLVTLIMMAAVISAFALASGTINDGRSMMETADRQRSAAAVLKLDLQGITAPTLPFLKPEANAGYVTVIEGDIRDLGYIDPAASLKTFEKVDVVDKLKPLKQDYTQYGDTDDILIFTTRSKGEPFIPNSNVQYPSQVAEVVWACLLDLNSPKSNPKFTLYRMVRVLRPDAPGNVVKPNGDITSYTLGDLTKRENRLFHTGNFPYAVDIATLKTALQSDPKNIVLTNVVGFDVKVWDPKAPVFTAGGVALSPGDVNYNPGATGPSSLGAYVDLGYASGTKPNLSYFSGLPKDQGYPGTAKYLNTPTWDTFPTHYDYDGKATDGVKDTPGQSGGVDDVTERQYFPPYPYPLRGIQVKIRVYEPDSRQVREVTVTEQFMPD